MSQTDTVLLPEFLDDITTVDIGPFRSDIPLPTYWYTTSFVNTLRGIREVAEDEHTVKWADHCDIDTKVIAMRAPFTYTGEVEQVMTRILKATRWRELKEIVLDLDDGGGHLPLKAQRRLTRHVNDKSQEQSQDQSQEQSQDQSMKIELFLDEEGDPFGFDLTVQGNEGTYRYARRGYYLFVEGTIYKSLLVEGTTVPQQTIYRLDARAKSTEWWAQVPGREPLADTSTVTSA